MSRYILGSAMAMTLCLTVSLAQAAPRGGESRGGSEGREGQQERGREGESQGGRGDGSGEKSAPGGDWSERTHSGKQSTAQSGNRQESGHGAAATGYAADQNKSQASGKEGAAAGATDENRNQPQYSGAQGAAAGAAAANKNQPQYSGAQGAAAGAAVANKNQPQYSGAQGAAAGAAAANRNQPQYSGAQGAAAGAAVANNNQPQYSGAQGAAIGAAAVNNNAPQYSGAQGAAVGAAVANRNAPTASYDAGPAAGLAAVRTSFNVSQPYSQAWCDTHPGTWIPSGWVAGAAWRPTDWNALAGLCGYGNATPVSYDYGVNVTAPNGNVLLNGQPLGTTAQFSQQAADLAAAGWAAAVSPADEWFPLGVYAMVRNEQQHAQFIVQLAINKEGILRGNYTDDVSDNTLAIRGAVDKKSQRAAWTVGDNKQTVMEAGLLDLTENETPALIHKNGKTDHWLLVRLTPPQASPK